MVMDEEKQMGLVAVFFLEWVGIGNTEFSRSVKSNVFPQYCNENSNMFLVSYVELQVAWLLEHIRMELRRAFQSVPHDTHSLGLFIFTLLVCALS